MKIIECTQGTPEWWEARRGIATASNFDRILTAKTRKLSSQVDGLICELIADSLNLGPMDGGLTTGPIQHGIETEAEARRFYELMHDCDTKQVGFCLTDDGRFGCSPDSLVGEDGLLELKCPLLKTHIGYLVNGGLPDDYRAQVHGQLIVTGRKWVDFMSYAMPLPPLVVRVTPDDYTDDLRRALEVFWVRYQEVKSRFTKTN